MKEGSEKLKLITSMFIFGTIGLFVRYIPLPSAVIAFARGLVGMLFLLLVTLFTKKHISLSAIKKNALWLLLSGICLGTNWILLFEAYRHTTVATATLCYYIGPVAATVLSVFLFGERLSARRALCAAAAVVGMVGVSGVLDGKHQGGGAGVLFGLAAAAFYAAVILINKKIKDLESYDKTVTQLGVSAVVMFVYCLFTTTPKDLSVGTGALLLLLLVGVLHTGVTYYLYFGAIGRLTAQTAALLSYIDPIVAVLLSFLVLGEKMSVFGIVGAVIIIASEIISELPERSSK